MLQAGVSRPYVDVLGALLCFHPALHPHDLRLEVELDTEQPLRIDLRSKALTPPGCR